MNTGWPAALSHFASSASCVVLPDPSMPSTTNSFPGYSCGVVRLFSIRCAFLVLPSGHVEVNRTTEQPFERRRVANRRPQFEFHVFRRAQAYSVVFAARQDVDRRDGLPVTAVEALGEPHHCGERANRAPLRAFQRAVPFVRFLRRRLSMVARDERDDLDFRRVEPAKIAVLDQIIRVAMMPFIA